MVIEKEFKVIIKVNEKKVKQLYPNYKFNWDTPEEFIDYLLEDIKEDTYKEFGYSIEVRN